MTTDIQNTDLYKKFIKALDIHDMRADDNPFVVKCCEIAKEYAKQSQSQQVTEISENVIKDLSERAASLTDYDNSVKNIARFNYASGMRKAISLLKLTPAGEKEEK